VRRPDNTLRHAPFIPIYTYDASGKRLVFDALVDSGADTTVVPKDLALVLGLNEGNELETRGIGGPVRVRSSKLALTVKGQHEAYSVNVPVLILQDQSNIPLILGRNGFFEEFHITFRQDQEKIVLKKVLT